MSSIGFFPQLPSGFGLLALILLALAVYVGLAIALGSWIKTRNHCDTDHEQRERLAFSKDRISESEIKLALTRFSNGTNAVLHENPITQNGRMVGTLIGPEISLDDGVVYAGEIHGDGHFDPNAAFVYDVYTLRVHSVKDRMDQKIASSSVVVLKDVVCDFVET